MPDVRIIDDFLAGVSKDHQAVVTKAMDAGFTKKIAATAGCYELELLVRNESFLDGEFVGFCCEELDYIRVKGWLLSEIEIN